jgi:arylsulfatase
MAQTFIEYPPMQKGASFNLEQVKQELQKKIQAQGAQ